MVASDTITVPSADTTDGVYTVSVQLPELAPGTYIAHVADRRRWLIGDRPRDVHGGLTPPAHAPTQGTTTAGGTNPSSVEGAAPARVTAE